MNQNNIKNILSPNSSQSEYSHSILPSKKTIAIIQLTRIGDLVQTFEACKKFKTDYPEFRLILISRKTFSTPIKFLLDETFDKIYEIDFRKIYDTKEMTLDRAVHNFNDHLKELFHENIILSANFSHSKTANYLNSIIPANLKIGPYYGVNGNLYVNDTWSQLINASVLTGSLNPFSLIDLFQLSLGKKATSQLNNHAPEESCESQKKPTITKIVCHPFASNSKKTWKIEKWIELICKTLKNHRDAKIYLVGATEERELSFKIINDPYLEQYRNRIINFVGNFNLKEVYELLKSSHLFIGHDSSVGHLAAVAKLKTLTISLGGVRLHETTPYGNDNLVITPKNDEYQIVPIQAVSAILDEIIANNNFEITDANKTFFLSSDVYKTQISCQGILKFNRLTHGAMSLNDVFREFYKIAWQFVLLNIDQETNIPVINDEVQSELQFTLKGLQALFDTAGLGKKYCTYILEEIAAKSPALEKIKTYSQRIDELSELEKSILDKFKVLRPVIDYYALTRANSQGDNLVELTHNTYNSYDALTQMCGILYDLSEKTLASHFLKNGASLTQKNI